MQDDYNASESILRVGIKMIKNKGYQYSKNNRMSLVVKEGWNGLSLGIGTNGLEMRIYDFELNIDPK